MNKWIKDGINKETTGEKFKNKKFTMMPMLVKIINKTGEVKYMEIRGII